MFNRPRPVPSKAALKVLYQLAYISSGTAVGVATLCAEERRRRTAILQKIADNAKRIRQSPRYVHNKVAAATDDAASGGYQYMPTQDPAEASHVRNTTLHTRDVHGEELPSQVDNGYAQLVSKGRPDWPDGRTHKRLAKGVDEDGCAPSEGLRNDHGIVPFEPIKGTHSVAISVAPDTSAGFTSSRESAFNTFESEQTHSGPFKRRYQRLPNILPRGVLKETGRLAFKMRSPWHEELSILQSAARGPQGKRPHFSTPELRGEPRQVQGKPEKGPEVCVQDDALKDDLRIFLNRAPWYDESGNHALDDGIQVAWLLLEYSLCSGSLADVASIILWLSFHGGLGAPAYSRICAAYRPLSRREDDHEALLELYTRVIALESFDALDDSAKAGFIVEVLLGTLQCSTNGAASSRHRLARQFWWSSKSILVKSDVMATVLQTSCEALLSQDHLDTAADLLQVVAGNLTQVSLQQFLHCHHTVIQGLLHKGWIRSACRLMRVILRLDLSTEYDTEVLPPLEDTLRQCAKLEHLAGCNLVEPFLGLLNSRPTLVQCLSIEVKTYLLVACTHFGSTSGMEYIQNIRSLHDTLCSNVTPEILSKLGPALTAHRMWVIWKNTRNLDAVQHVFEASQVDRLETGLGQPNAIVHCTMVEIYTSANRSHAALGMLNSVWKGGSSPGVETFMVAAVVLSKLRDWKKLRSLLQLMADCNLSLTFENVDGTAKANQVLSLFDQCHPVSETGELIKELMRCIAFRPNRTTLNIILIRVTVDGSPRLIPKWLKFFGDLGHRLIIDDRIAESLLRRYQSDFRPGHRELMRYCRALVAATRFQPGPFYGLLRKAIADDVKYYDVNNPIEMRQLGAANLLLLTQSRDMKHIPPPYGKVERIPEGIRTRETRSCSTAFAGDGTDMVELLDSDTVDGYTETDLDKAADTANLDALIEEFNSATVEALPSGDTYSPHVGTRSERQRPTAIPVEDTDVPAIVEGSVASILGHHYRYRHRWRAEQAMILALSLKQYHIVLNVFQASFDASGLPLSPLALEVAIEARIRRDFGRVDNAELMLEEARKTGFNVSCALGPIIMHRMFHMPGDQKRDADQMRRTVTDYYRVNEENGWPVKHYVGVNAANVLVNNNEVGAAVGILDAIHDMHESRESLPSITAMTIYLKAYTRSSHLQGYTERWRTSGIRWVLDTVLTHDIRPDRPFLREVKQTLAIYHIRRSEANRTSEVAISSLVRYLEEMYSALSDKRLAFKENGRAVGRELRDTLIQCVNHPFLRVRKGEAPHDIAAAAEQVLEGDDELTPKADGVVIEQTSPELVAVPTADWTPENEDSIDHIISRAITRVNRKQASLRESNLRSNRQQHVANRRGSRKSDVAYRTGH